MAKERLVKFIEFHRGRRAQAKAATIMVNSAQVGAVLGRREYTTLLVQGQWFHVLGDIDTVIGRLGWSPE